MPHHFMSKLSSQPYCIIWFSKFSCFRDSSFRFNVSCPAAIYDLSLSKVGLRNPPDLGFSIFVLTFSPLWFPWICLDFHRFPVDFSRISIDFHGFPWISLHWFWHGFHAFPLDFPFMSHWFPWISMDFALISHGFRWISNWFPWISDGFPIDFHEFPMDSVDLYGFPSISNCFALRHFFDRLGFEKTRIACRGGEPQFSSHSGKL